MSNQNPICNLLNIDYPIIQVGMAGSTTPELVAAISDEGGLGTIGAGYMNHEQLLTEINEVHQLTQNSFAVNLFVPEHPDVDESAIKLMQSILEPYYSKYNLNVPDIKSHTYESFEQMIDIIIEKHVPIVSFTFGIPDNKMISKLQSNDIKVIGSAASVEEAFLCEQAKMDAVVIQGYEAGGHRANFKTTNNIGLFALIPQVADVINIPIIAAGGIMDHRGINAALALGASGVQMGTAFLTSKESKAPVIHKEAIFNASETDTVLTKAISGKEARGIKNLLISQLEKFNDDILPYPYQNDLTSSLRKQAALHYQVEDLHLWCGQAPRLAKNNTAKEIFSEIIKNVSAY